MTSNEISFILLNFIIAEGVDAYVHLSKYIKTVVNFQRNLLIFQLYWRNRIIRK